jgi:hypothetical protein
MGDFELNFEKELKGGCFLIGTVEEEYLNIIFLSYVRQKGIKSMHCTWRKSTSRLGKNAPVLLENKSLCSRLSYVNIIGVRSSTGTKYFSYQCLGIKAYFLPA